MVDSGIERYFAILGLTSTASESEVKEARNFVTKAFHPDRYQPGSKDQERAHQRQVEINEAYTRVVEWLRVQEQRRSISAQDLGTRTGTVRPTGSFPLQFSFGSNYKQRLVFAVKTLLVLILCAQWGISAFSWLNRDADNHSKSAIDRSENVSVTAVAPSAPANSKPLKKIEDRGTVASKTDADLAEATSQSDAQKPVYFLLLILSSLGAAWFIFAPEAKQLVQHWTNNP